MLCRELCTVSKVSSIWERSLEETGLFLSLSMELTLQSVSCVSKKMSSDHIYSTGAEHPRNAYFVDNIRESQ